MTEQQLLAFLEALYPPGMVLTRAKHLELFSAVIKVFISGGSGLDGHELTVIPSNTDGALVSLQGVALDFVGQIEVKRNGKSIPTWRGSGVASSFPAYFCIGTSATPRPNGRVQKGDTLRWNASVAGPLLAEDEIVISAIVGVPFPADPTSPASVFATANDPVTLDAASSGPNLRWIAYDNGVDDLVIYAYSPRVGRREVFSFPPTTPVT